MKFSFFDSVLRNTCTALSQSELRNVCYYKSYTWQNNKRTRSPFEVNHSPGLHNNNNNSIIVIIIYMTELLQSDWLRGVQLLILIIFVVTGGGGGGSGKSKQQKIQYGGEINLVLITNVDEFN